MARNHPIVNGKPTTFVALGEKLGVDPNTVRMRYNVLPHPVTLAQLREWDKAAERREKRNATIIKMRRQEHKTLAQIQKKFPELTLARIQQIAGPL